MTSESADIKPALVQISAHLVASAFAPLAAVVARLDRATQYSDASVMESKEPGVLGPPLSRRTTK
jgi:hypothetical protein